MELNAVKRSVEILIVEDNPADARLITEAFKDSEVGHQPVVVLTTSQTDRDLFQAYDLHANCYLTKPLEFDRFMAVVSQIRDFWLSAVTLPPR